MFKISIHSKKHLAIFIATVAICTVAFQISQPTKAYASYNGGRVIDDSVFLNSNTMSKSQIQSFLVSKGSGLASKNYKLWCEAGQTRQWYEAVNAPCDQNIPASQIIYYAAQIYGLNPQVILATMQKEQSLITDPTPSSYQLNQAMGYACPDSGGCGASTFSYQVDYGTWVLRHHRERANGNNSWWKPSSGWVCGTEKNYYKPNLYPGQNVRFYDDNGVLYRTHFINNPATSSLYCYTPHAYNNPQGLYGRSPYGTKGMYYSGSYNFVSSFESWFGSTEGTPFFEISNRIYMTGANNTYYYVPSPETLRDYGYGKSTTKVLKVSSSYLSGMTNAGALPLIARFEGSPVYAISQGNRYYFTSPQIFSDYGFSFGEEAKLPSWALHFVSDGGNMQNIMSDGISIFSIEAGKSRPFCSATAYKTLGSPIYSTRPRVNLNTNFAKTLTPGAPIATAGALIKSASGSYGIWNGSSLQSFNSSAANDLGLGACIASNSVYSGLPTAGSTLNKLAKNSLGNLFILDTRSKLSVSTGDLPELGFVAGDFVTTNDAFLNSVSSRNMGRLIRVKNNINIFFIDNGVKHYVYSKDDLYGLGFNLNQVITISGPTSQLFSSGAPIFKQGRLVRVDSKSAVYLIGNDFEKRYIPDRNIMSDFGFSFRSVLSVSAASLADYPTTGALTNVVKDTSGRFWLVSQGYAHRISPTLLGSSYFNINQSGTQELTNEALGHLPRGRIITEVFRAGNSSKIYIIDNGQKRYVTSPAALISSGNSMSDVVSLSPAYVNSLPNGPAYN